MIPTVEQESQTFPHHRKEASFHSCEVLKHEKSICEFSNQIPSNGPQTGPFICLW